MEKSVNWQALALQAGCLARVAEVHCAGALAEAAEAIERRLSDLVLLDVSLPDGEGYQLCSALQSGESTQDIPIVFLNARGHTRDKITAFRLGADDYLEKPFEPEELRAGVESRIEKHARRRQRRQVLCKGGLRIDVDSHRVWTIGPEGTVALELTPHEFRLLYHLARHEDRVFTRAHLMQAVWNDTVVAERTVDSHISNLRRKLGAAAEQIRSVRSVGYRFRSR
jgi:two-component system phosphate regulon response regulator PhoB